jgi:hypothetical protein
VFGRAADSHATASDAAFGHLALDPLFDAADDLRDAALGDLVIGGQLGLTLARGLILQIDLLIARTRRRPAARLGRQLRKVGLH